MTRHAWIWGCERQKYSPFNSLCCLKEFRAWHFQCFVDSMILVFIVKSNLASVLLTEVHWVCCSLLDGELSRTLQFPEVVLRRGHIRPRQFLVPKTPWTKSLSKIKLIKLTSADGFHAGLVAARVVSCQNDWQLHNSLSRELWFSPGFHY